MVRNRAEPARKGARGGDLLRRILGEDESDRRIVILRALWRLMLAKGYASTSLTDVARKAGLSASHLSYYFRTKEEIVSQLYDAILDSLLLITTRRAEPALERIHLLASYAFLEPLMDVEDRTIGLEMTYIAVHNARFQKRVQDYSAKMDSYLTHLFAETPRAFSLSAEDAALLAGSIWHGLVVTSYYYEGFDLSRARVLFRESLLMLAGLAGGRSGLVDGRRDNSAPGGRTAPAATVSTADSSHRGELLKAILGEDDSDRRTVILRALWRLMLEKGYASTTLTEVATKAGLSPSHLAYYFRNKEAIVLTLYDALTEGILSITTQRDEPPLEQFELLVRHVFLEPVMDISDRTIVLELMGIAVHNAPLRDRWSQNTKRTIDYLRGLFAKSPRALNLSAEDAAILAASLWTGLLTNSYFHKSFDWSRARVLFRQSLLMLAGLTDQRFSWPAPDARGRERKQSISRKNRARA